MNIAPSFDPKNCSEFTRGQLVQAAHAVMFAAYARTNAPSDHKIGVSIALDYLIDELRRLLHTQKLRSHKPFESDDEAIALAKLIVFAAEGYTPEV